MAWGAAIAMAVVIVCNTSPPAPAELAWMRWLRTLADHPIRVCLAATLLLFAFSRPESGDDGGGSSRS
jgi:hypothetical protein